MGCETRTVYPGKRNKGLSSTFQPPEEGQSVQRPKHCDKNGDKDEDNSLKNVSNVHNTSLQKYRLMIIVQIRFLLYIIGNNNCLKEIFKK